MRFRREPAQPLPGNEPDALERAKALVEYKHLNHQFAVEMSSSPVLVLNVVADGLRDVVSSLQRWGDVSIEGNCRVLQTLNDYVETLRDVLVKEEADG